MEPKIFGIPALQDNYIWVIHQHNTCVVVDPSEANSVIKTLNERHLTLKTVLITHHHIDHIGGVMALRQVFPYLPVYGPGHLTCITHPIGEGDVISLPFNLPITAQVLAIPGHTLDHLAYVLANPAAIFCGDTLFAAGCGRLFEGKPKQLQHSLHRLSAYPDATALYPAHEFTLSNLRFAQTVEPENQAIYAQLQTVKEQRAENLPTLPTTVKQEKATNPFLRTNSLAIQAAVAHHFTEDFINEERTFALLRQWKDHF